MSDATAPPVLSILCGLPFAGKSVLARAIAAHTGAAIVSFDDLYAAHGTALARTRDTPAVWQAIRDLAGDQIAASLRRGVPVVYDNTNFRVTHRDALRAVALSSGGQALTIFVDTPPAIIARRRAANLQTRTRGDITDADLAHVLAHWQPPRQREHAIAFRPDTAIDDWLRGFPPSKA